jgi:hypothetical protein
VRKKAALSCNAEADRHWMRRLPGWVGAFVAGQVNEELVGGQQVRQVGPGGQVLAALPRLVATGQGVAALGGDDFGAELVE